MAEVVVSTPELTVLGGPASVQVDTNIGPPGNRGVFVFFGLQSPSTAESLSAFNSTLTEPPIPFDLYIVVDSASDEYLAVYQYVFEDGVPQWNFRIRLRPNFFGANKVATFIDGEATVEINSEDLGLTSIQSFVNTRFQYSVQATLSNYDLDSEFDPGVSGTHFPAAVSVEVGDLFQDPSDQIIKLPITIHAAEFDGTSFSPVGEITLENPYGKNVFVHLSVLGVSPTEILNFIDEAGGS
jgi:hypothetical protein